MTRTEQNASTRTVSTATHLGWSLTFTHESGANGSVSCTGNNGSGGNVSANSGSGAAMPTPAGGGATSVNSSVNFYGVEYDAAVAKAIVDEMKLILAPITTTA